RPVGEAHEGLSAAPEPEDRSAVFYGLPSGIRRTSEAERTSPTDGASGSDRRLARVTCDATCRSSAERNTRSPRPPANGSAETPARWPRPPGRSSGGTPPTRRRRGDRSEEHTSELQSRGHLVCRLLLEKKK